MDIFTREEKALACANHSCNADFGWFVDTGSRFSGSSLYLHHVLIQIRFKNARFRNLSLLSR